MDFLYLNHEDIIRNFKIKKAINEVERSFKEFSKGNIRLSHKIVQTFNKEEQDVIIAMPTTIWYKNIAGLKWISVFPKNPIIYKIPTLMALIILNDIKNGTPLCVMDGTFISNIRTGIVTAIAAKYLAREDSEVIGMIGSGNQAKSQIISLVEVCPQIKEVRVTSRSIKNCHKFKRYINETIKNKGIKIIPLKSKRDAIEGSDIIVTATTAMEPLLKDKWIKKGSFYSHVGGWEDEYEVALNSDKIVTDNWEDNKHSDQKTLALMYREGLITDKDIYADLSDIILKKVPGRESELERIYFSSVGLAFTDIVIAYNLYTNALKNNVGEMINFFRKEFVHVQKGSKERNDE